MFISWLAVFASILTGPAVAHGNQNIEFSIGSSDTVDGPISDDVIHATPFPALLLSEILIDNDSEIEPKESGFASYSFTIDRTLGITTYLKKSELILISLSIRELIFPFHTYL